MSAAGLVDGYWGPFEALGFQRTTLVTSPQWTEALGGERAAVSLGGKGCVLVHEEHGPLLLVWQTGGALVDPRLLETHGKPRQVGARAWSVLVGEGTLRTERWMVLRDPSRVRGQQAGVN